MTTEDGPVERSVSRAVADLYVRAVMEEEAKYGEVSTGRRVMHRSVLPRVLPAKSGCHAW